MDREILGNARPDGEDWTKGIDRDAAEQLEEVGVPAIAFLVTEAGGTDYIEDCRREGVPVPEFMFGSEWEPLGEIENEFISDESRAELWVHRSESPKGICLALPRYPGKRCGSDDRACLLSITCLGTQVSKACFFDNPNGVPFEDGVQVGIENFRGGVDLVSNGQGECTDCHAGENPFVVHPEKPPFSVELQESLKSLGWYDPLVDASWLQNPGPTNLLDSVKLGAESPRQCTECHRAGLAGRFPEISERLRGYCGTVLAHAFGEFIRRSDGADTPGDIETDKVTMPAPIGTDKELFRSHIDALKRACLAPSPGLGAVIDVDQPDDEGFVSPPTVSSTLYKCGRKVMVHNVKLHADVRLYVNNFRIEDQVATETDAESTNVEFEVPELELGDKVAARQFDMSGAFSELSNEIVVRDHTLDYPDGLPAPEISPTLIHECASIIGVKHAPNVNLTVSGTSANGDPIVPVTAATSVGWSFIRPAKQSFDEGDVFVAEAELCGLPSGPSAEQVVVDEPPGMLPTPTFHPERTYPGQEVVTVGGLVNGAHGVLRRDGFSDPYNFDTPVTVYPHINVGKHLNGPLAGSDGELLVSQGLCDPGPSTETSGSTECEELSPPIIRHPRVGDTSIVVTESVPGATIRIYNADGEEIGDSGGTVINLRPPALTSADTITVLQDAGFCSASTGYQVSVRN